LPLDADPELLHRALSNLVLNAMDAMPDGGMLTIFARPHGDNSGDARSRHRRRE
jgi:signal transduction histidine kinase